MAKNKKLTKKQLKIKYKLKARRLHLKKANKRSFVRPEGFPEPSVEEKESDTKE